MTSIQKDTTANYNNTKGNNVNIPKIFLIDRFHCAKRPYKGYGLISIFFANLLKQVNITDIGKNYKGLGKKYLLWIIYQLAEGQ